jgi:hypothetical protein
MILYVDDLGKRIERLWRQHSYSEEVFPALVLEALQQDPPAGKIDLGDIVDWAFSSAQEFQQPRGKLFGDPPVMLFQAPRFYIEALFWNSSTTSIHEHGFTGAFTVLAGSSVHSHWRFSPERTINSRMICGRLERISTEILRSGDMRPIFSGDRLIHQLFHLDQPSVTLVIRTYIDRNSLPQYNYLPPGLAVDPEDDRDSLRKRRLLLLNGMARGYIGGLTKYAGQLIEDGDLETIFYMFYTLKDRKLDREIVEKLFDVALQRHGAVVSLFRQVCEEEQRVNKILALRAKILHPEARFLLALLILMPDREAILEAIRHQFPDSDPVERIEAWLETMSGKETIGFDFEGVNRIVFRSLMAGEDAAALFQRLQAQFQDDRFEARREEVLELAKRLTRLSLFRPLLSQSPLQA